MYMDGSLLGDLEFFPPTDKSANNVPVAAGGVPPTNYGPSLGIYQNEESVDFSSWILDACSEVPAVPSPRVNNATTQRSYREAPNVAGDPATFSFRNFCSPPPSAQPVPGNNACINMYDSETNAAEQMTAGNVISLPHSRTTITSLAEHGPLVIPGSDHLGGTRPAPGKAAKKSKKKVPDKSTKEYREKRERNNVAVRKSREKNRQQILETQQRVKELEEENSALQSKITLLSKELKVLKDLFSSAGVNQPSSLCLKPEPEN